MCVQSILFTIQWLRGPSGALNTARLTVESCGVDCPLLYLPARVSRSLCAAGTFCEMSGFHYYARTNLLALTNMFDHMPEVKADISKQLVGFSNISTATQRLSGKQMVPSRRLYVFLPRSGWITFLTLSHFTIVHLSSRCSRGADMSLCVYF